MNNLASYFPRTLGISEAFGALEFPTFKKLLWSVHDHVIPHERNNYHPHILSHRFLALLSILVVTIKIASISFVALSPATTTLASNISNETIVSLANSARVAGGLSELTTSSLLSKAAQNKANDMLAKQYFSHNTPDGATPWSFIKAVGYSYTTAGENLAIDFTDADSVQSAWMNSPGHRANIMNKNFTQVGIGIVSGTFDNHPTTIVVQMFGNPLNAPVTLKESPTVVAPAPSTEPAPATLTPAPTVVSEPKTISAPVTSAAPDPTTVTSPATEANLNPEQQLAIIETKTAKQGDNLYLEIQTTPNAVKALAFFGGSSVMLDPLGNGLWQTTIPVSSLGQYDNLVVQVADINGKMHQQPVVEFSNGLNQSLNGNVEGAQITVFGTSFNPKIWEQKTLMLVLAALLTLLVLAIAIRRHVQHLSLVANTSFVAMLVAMLLII